MAVKVGDLPIVRADQAERARPRAGGGVKRGFRYGATDELGYKAAENPVTVYDLHATILQLLGLEHTQLSWYHNGVRRKLTDVHGHVVKDLLA